MEIEMFNFDESFIGRPKGVTKEQDKAVRELFKEIDRRRMDNLNNPDAYIY